jgi:MFS family permease
VDENKRQLRILFMWYLLAWIVAGGLLPLLPVHASNLGAEPGIIGYYMAFAYIMIAAGSLYAARLSRGTHSRRRWLIASSVGVPIGAAWMAWAGDVWQLAAATALVWLCFGLAAPLSNTLIGLRASGAQRGRVFGIMGMTQGLGTLIGGATMGPAADRWTYRGMFLLATLIGALFLLVSLFIRDVQVAAPAGARQDTRAQVRLGWRYWAFLGAMLMVAVSDFVALISRSLVMNGAGFGATAISSATSIMGLVGLMAAPAGGWLSDRLGRRILLAATFGVSALALGMLSASVALWHFLLVAALAALATARSPLASALITDMLPGESLGLGMALLSVSGWVGGIIGFGLAGNALQALGPRTTLLAAALLPMLAISVLASVRPGVAVPVGERPAEAPAADGGAC